MAIHKTLKNCVTKINFFFLTLRHLIKISQKKIDFFLRDFFTFFFKMVSADRNFCTNFKKFERFLVKKSKFFCEMLIKCRSVRKSNFYFFDTVFESFMDSQSLLTRPLFCLVLFSQGTKLPAQWA